MKELTNLISVNTSYSKEKVVKILKRGGYDCLFIDFSRNQEGFMRAIVEGADPELVVEKMKDLGLVKEPEDTQDYKAAKPLFEFLPSLEATRTALYCYKEDASIVLSRDIAVRILLLTARARIGKIEAGEWKEVIKEDIYYGIESARGEAEYVARRAGVKDICMGASEELLASLSCLGFKVKEVIVDEPCKPLDILSERIKREILYGEYVEDEEVRALVEEHLNFVEMIIERGYEAAYKSWSSL